MKKILKLIATLTLMFSCFYLAISLFLSHLMINDILTNVVESSTVTDALVDSCKDAFKTLNVDEDKAREVVTSIQQDPTTQKLISEYVDTAINDAMLGENTYDDSLLKEVLKNKKEDVYDLIQPTVPKVLYDQAMNQIDLSGAHQQVVNKIQDTINSNEKLKLAKKAYELKNKPNTMISIVLMIISTVYLILISCQDKLITKCLSVTYLLSGILTFLIAFTIVLGLTTMISSTMDIQLPSIKYMYICGSAYFFVGIILLIMNAFLKRTSDY